MVVFYAPMAFAERELSTAGWIEIDKRRRIGERLADILSQLKVLK